MKVCPHCREPLMSIDIAAGKWLKDLPTLTGATARRFADETGANYMSLVQYQLPKRATSWRKLILDERKRRMPELEGHPATAVSVALGFARTDTFRDWYQTHYGRSYSQGLVNALPRHGGKSDA